MKMFTYCGNIQTGDKRRYSDVVVHRRRNRWYRHSGYEKSAIALLLHSDDPADPITEKDFEDFAKSDVVKALFPAGFIATPSDHVEGDWLLSPSAQFTELPDKATIDSEALRIVTDHGVKTIDLRQRYNNCRSLVKAVGCHECPDKGMACLRREVTDIPFDQSFTADDEDVFKDTLQNRVTKIGAFTYLSPKMTTPEDHHFVPGLRHYEDHDFGRVAENSEAFSNANKKSAAKRRFVKENCSVCPLSGPCRAAHSCAGPYPVSEQMTQAILAKWADRLRDQRTFTEWQFWALARSGGMSGTYHRNSHSRYQVSLHGLSHVPAQGWTVDIWRSRTELTYLTSINAYETLRVVFDGGLPETEEEARSRGLGRPSNDTAVALYLMLTEHNRSNRFRGGWGGDYFGILYKQLREDHVAIKFSGPRYTRYAEQIKSYAKFFEVITHRMGVDQIVKIQRPGVYANN